MKNLIFCLLLFGFISTGHSQILLKEAKVDYKPESLKIDPITNQLVIEVPEKKVGEFQSDPLAFVRNRFDFQRFLNDNQNTGYDYFVVHFKSSKGYLNANLDSKGTLVSTYQNFKNIRLPQEALLQIRSEYRDAAIVGSKYLAYSKGWDIKKEIFRVKIKDGDKTRNIRIRKQDGYLSLAGR